MTIWIVYGDQDFNGGFSEVFCTQAKAFARIAELLEIESFDGSWSDAAVQLFRNFNYLGWKEMTTKPQTVDGLPVDYSLLAQKYRSGIENYIEHRIRPGSFLSAVLMNDFKTAVMRVDSDTTRGDLQALSLWLTIHAPSKCHGSENKFNNWLKRE